jgi:hypothetical protein
MAAMTGTTPRDNSERSRKRASQLPTPRWVRVFGAIILVLLLLFVVLHMSGHGFGGHSHH